jgi:hypothetical protein
VKGRAFQASREVMSSAGAVPRNVDVMNGEVGRPECRNCNDANKESQ